MKVYLEEIKGLSIGHSLTIPKGTTRVGRKDCDINIANQRISHNQAEIHFSGTRVFVLDRNSTNGTFVNGRRVERMALRDGDLISFGGTGEEASAEFRLHIISILSGRRVIVIIKKAGKINKLLLGFLLLLLLSFILWLFIPAQTQGPVYDKETGIARDINRPWIGAEPLITSPLYGGSSVICALGDEILLPDGAKWNTYVNYDEVKNSDPFDDLMYVTVINPADADDESVEGGEKVVSTVTAQRFKKTFSSDIAPYIENNFKWHESRFLKDNGITDQKFSYSSSSLGVWQWVIWEKETKFNLYASCITKRGRIILQASSFDPYILKRFFQYVASSYKEGSGKD